MMGHHQHNHQPLPSLAQPPMRGSHHHHQGRYTDHWSVYRPFQLVGIFESKGGALLYVKKSEKLGIFAQFFLKMG